MAIEEHDRWATEGLEVIRSEEELHATVEAIPYGRVRLSKRIVVETVRIEVELHREELVVERLPVEGPAGDDAATPTARSTPAGRLRDSLLARFAKRPEPAGISADEVTLELLEERYEVVKRVVPRGARAPRPRDPDGSSACVRNGAQGAGRGRSAAGGRPCRLTATAPRPLATSTCCRPVPSSSATGRS